MPFISSPNGPVWVPERQQAATAAVDLSGKSILIMDRGLKTYLAEFFARFYGTVFYHCITGGPYEEAPHASIGKGLPGVIHTKRPGDIIRMVDDLTIFYPDIYDGDETEMLRALGCNVCGAGAGEIMELDKLYFYDRLVESKLPVADMHKCTGLDELLEHSKERKNKPFYAKLRDEYRGDWETTLIWNEFDTENLVARVRDKVGAKRAAEMEILCFEPIDSECEGGIDGFRLGGKMANLISCGYEAKDVGYIGRVMDKIPAIFQPILDGLAPAYEALGYRGPYSNECRITADGTVYPIDETNRCGEPPTSGLCEALGISYAEVVYLLARGIMPTLTMEHSHFAQINLWSDYHKAGNELYVDFPEEISQWVKLQNHVMRDGRHYIIPNDNEGGFGAVVAVGKSVEEVKRLVMQRVGMVKARGLEYDENCFETIGKCIEAGRKFGINF